MNGRKFPTRTVDSSDVDELEAQELYDLLRSHLSPIWSVDEDEIDIPEQDELSHYGTSVNWEELR